MRHKEAGCPLREPDPTKAAYESLRKLKRDLEEALDTTPDEHPLHHLLSASLERTEEAMRQHMDPRGYQGRQRFRAEASYHYRREYER